MKLSKSSVILFVCLLLPLVISAKKSKPGKKTRNITIEMSIFTDYGLFKKWVKFYNKDYRESVKGIYYMYSNVFKTVRDRFWGLGLDGIRFDIRFANTMVVFQSNGSDYIEKGEGVKLNETTIDEYKALKEFKKYLGKEGKKLNSSDVNVFVTGYDFATGLDHISDGFLITNQKIHIGLHEVGLHRTADSLTQALTQALGVFYDITDRDCNDGRFIMTADRRECKFDKVENLNKFSACSKKYFQETYGKERFPWDQKNPVKNKFDVDWCARTHPIGLTYPIYRQCQFLYGPDSTCCTDALSANLDICIRLGCTDPKNNNQCTFSGDQRAYDRTSCGEGKWCLEGKCVEDDKAPPNKRYDDYVKYL